MQNIFLAFLILFSAFQICFAQEKSKTVLFDELGDMDNSCDRFLGRLYNFFRKLADEPSYLGYIIINGNKNDKSVFRYERRIYGSLEMLKFDKSRLMIIRSENLEKANVRFYLVPQDAENPKVNEIQLDLTISAKEKPFIFNTTVWDTESSCPSGSQLKLFSDYLNANPNVFGNIVIFDKSKSFFQKEKISSLKN